MVQGKILRLKAKINLSKGKTDQAISRKGKKNLTERELLRRYLKSPRGKSFLHDLKEQYSKMVADPVEYILKERLKSLEQNNKLKFFLLKELKYYKLKDFTLDPTSQSGFGLSKERSESLNLFRKTISPSDGAGALSCKGFPSAPAPATQEVEIKSIPSIRDRAVFVFLNLIMENYMEPLGDPHSFGFRLGRDSQQAVSIVANQVDVKSRHTFGQAANLTVEKRLLCEANYSGAVKDKHIINVEVNEAAFSLQSQSALAVASSGLSKTKDKGCIPSVSRNISPK